MLRNMYPAFQLNGSAEIQRLCSFPFGSLRLPRVPLGGFATSRLPLAAVAARGAQYNINDSDSVLMQILIKCKRLSLYSLLLCISDSLYPAI